MEFMDNVIEAMRSDLAKIKRDAADVQTCLVSAESPSAVANLRKQVDDLAEELLTSQQHLSLKTSGKIIHKDHTLKCLWDSSHLKSIIDLIKYHNAEILEIFDAWGLCVCVYN